MAEEKKQLWLTTYESGEIGGRQRIALNIAKDLAHAYLASGQQHISPDRVGKAVIDIFDAVGQLFGLE